MSKPLYERDTLLRDLRRNVVEIQFNKVTDGSQRLMRCTLKLENMPPTYRNLREEQDKEEKYHSDNPDLIAAWDVEKGGWRSFRISTVLYAQALDSY
jgi:hypothetical protein